MWRYYLAYCQAGFEEQRIDVVQLTLSHNDAAKALH
jgi:cyclopropane-fatty-acyl-phospholipid synthase